MDPIKVDNPLSPLLTSPPYLVTLTTTEAGHNLFPLRSAKSGWQNRKDNVLLPSDTPEPCSRRQEHIGQHKVREPLAPQTGARVVTLARNRRIKQPSSIPKPCQCNSYRSLGYFSNVH